MLRSAPEPPKNSSRFQDKGQEETRQPLAQKRRNSILNNNERTNESNTSVAVQHPKSATRGSSSPPPNSENFGVNPTVLKTSHPDQTARSWPGFTPEYLVSFDPAHIVHSNESCAVASSNVPHHLTNVPMLAEKTGTTILSYLGKYRQVVSFPCVLMHWANTLAKHHTVSRYSNPDAFHGMRPHEPMATQWTYLEQNERYTLGNGLVILGRSKYKRIMGLTGVAVRVEGMMFAGIRESASSNIPDDKRADGATGPSKSKTCLQSVLPSAIFPDVAIIDSLPAATPVPFVLYQFDAPHRIGRDLVVQRGAVVDTDCVIHGPFVYKGIQFTNEDIIHADGVFARICGSRGVRKPAAGKISAAALKSRRENGSGNRHVPQSPMCHIEEPRYIEYCIDARLNDPTSACYQGCQLSLPRSLKKTIPATPSVCAPSTLECFGHCPETLPAGAIPALCLHPGYLSSVATCAERAVSSKGYASPTYPGPGFKRCQWCSRICGGLGELPYSYMLTPSGTMLPYNNSEVLPSPQLPTRTKLVTSGHKVCGKCDVYYCDRECQLAHWQTHKRMCMVWKHYKKPSSMVPLPGAEHSISDQARTMATATATTTVPLPSSATVLKTDVQKSAQPTLQSLPLSHSSINVQSGSQDNIRTKRPQIDRRWVSPIEYPSISETSIENPQAPSQQEKYQKHSAQQTRGANKPEK